MLLETARVKATTDMFQGLADNLQKCNYHIYYQLLHVKIPHNTGENIAIKRHDSTIDDNDLKISTDKWNPMTYAVYTGNLDLIKLLIKNTICPIKKLLKVPGLYNTQEINRLFPFVVALQ